jgi:hypothetical protein
MTPILNVPEQSILKEDTEGIWCLYRDGQFYLMEETGVPEENH